MGKKDIIKFMNSDSREKLSGLTPEMLEVGELALITETDYERLYCKNNDGEIVPIHRILDAGEFETSVEPVQDYLVYRTTEPDEEVTIMYMSKPTNFIRLEDGSIIENSGDGTGISHNFAEPGDHKIWIEFKEDVTDFSNCFVYCTQLVSIPENLFTNCPSATNFKQCFAGCSSLTGGIPENLFSTNTAVTNFNSCFSSCDGLTSIPENLFINNTAVIDFANCFAYCTSLENIPANLFSNNTAVTNFNYCFAGCSSLTGGIPENLFSTNTAVTNFNSCFSSCDGLTSIPENLFTSNTAVTDFNRCFYNCTGLTGNCPADNDGTPIYNRSSGKSGYAKVTSYTYCFYNCTGLTDYNSIPEDWK